jgi:hypothetical protein
MRLHLTQRHHEVRRVVVGRAVEAELCVVRDDAGDRPLVENTALLHEDDRVEQEEGLRGRLVDREQHRAVARSHALEQIHQAKGGERVQARGRLIEEQELCQCGGKENHTGGQDNYSSNHDVTQRWHAPWDA